MNAAATSGAGVTIMILNALIAAVCGAVLGRSFKVLILIPTSFSIWIVALLYGWVRAFSLFHTLAVAFLLATCLQLGYLLCVAVTDFKKSRREARQLYATH
jgi:hypothetical protein